MSSTGSGSATTMSSSSSVSALLSAIIPTLLFAIVCIVLFLLFRKKFQRIYEPRTYLGRFNQNQKTPPTHASMFGWIADFRSLPDDYIFNHQSLDGYLFLRFFKMCFVICVVGALITWPILFPVYATTPTPAGAQPQRQFDKISFSAAVSQPNRYYATAFVAWIFFAFVLFVIGRESIFYVHIRQAWLLSPNNATRMSTRTVLFTDVPDEYCNEKKLRSLFQNIRQVWIATDTKELQDLVEDRDKTAIKLEAAEIKLSKQANQQRLKMNKKNKPFDDPIAWTDGKRPTHKLKFLIGKKVDTISWCREHLQELIPKTEKLQAKHWSGEATKAGAVFVEFNDIHAAQAVFQRHPSHDQKIFTPRAIAMTPDEVVWKNLSMKKSKRRIMGIVAVAIVAAMIIFWTPFTVFVGAIANINYLTSKVPFLSFINNIPSVILGVVTGLLPSLILTILMALVPIFLRLLSKLTGRVTVGQIELQVQGWYFVFQVIIVFLVTTFSSGAAAVGAQIAQNPASAPALLAQNLPKASNFYISYVMFQAIAAIGSLLLNIAGLAIFLILKSLLMKTPRKRFSQYISISGLGWGSTYPKFEILILIGITYSMIAPLILGFTAIGFALFYVAFRYNLMYTLDTANISTQGETYPKALGHMFVGIYLAQVCLIGLLGINAGSGVAAVGPLVIVVILLVATIVFQLLLQRAIKPLLRQLPGDLLGGTGRQGGDIQMENGQHFAGEYGSGRDRKRIASDDSGKEMLQQNNEAIISTGKRQPGLYGMMLRVMHPSWLPTLAPFMAQPQPEYDEDTRREAYLDPAITTPTPLLWIVHDDMGISAREKELSGKVIGTTDQGAYWEQKKGKLMTIWEDQAPEKQDALIREAPIYEDKPMY